VNNQSRSDTLAQLMTDLHTVRQQLAQVREDLDRLEATHSYPKPQKSPKVNNLDQTNLYPANNFTQC
jgi:uncharacterized membrane protein